MKSFSWNKLQLFIQCLLYEYDIEVFNKKNSFAETETPGPGYGFAYPYHIRPALRRGQESELQGVSEQIPTPLETQDEASGPKVLAVPVERGR